MKNLFLKITLLSAVLVLSFGCENVVHNVVGKWERVTDEEVKPILEFTRNGNWNYFKNDSLVEEGTFKIDAEEIILKHHVPEHSHDHSEGEHADQDHEHSHPEDHVLKYTLNEDKTELSLISEEKTSVYKKIEE